MCSGVQDCSEIGCIFICVGVEGSCERVWEQRGGREGRACLSVYAFLTQRIEPWDVCYKTGLIHPPPIPLIGGKKEPASFNWLSATWSIGYLRKAAQIQFIFKHVSEFNIDGVKTKRSQFHIVSNMLWLVDGENKTPRFRINCTIITCDWLKAHSTTECVCTEMQPEDSVSATSGNSSRQPKEPSLCSKV